MAHNDRQKIKVSELKGISILYEDDLFDLAASSFSLLLSAMLVVNDYARISTKNGLPFFPSPIISAATPIRCNTKNRNEQLQSCPAGLAAEEKIDGRKAFKSNEVARHPLKAEYASKMSAKDL